MGKRRCFLGFFALLFVALFGANAFATSSYVCIEAMNYKSCAPGLFRETTGTFVNGSEMFVCTACPDNCTCAGGDATPECKEVEDTDVNISYNLSSISGIIGNKPVNTVCVKNESCVLAKGDALQFKRPGYVFTGWTETAGASIGRFSITATKDMEVYPVWSECQAGTYKPADSAATDACQPADPGYYVADDGATEQVACKGATYSEGFAATRCEQCSELNVTLGEGSIMTKALYSSSNDVHDSRYACEFEFNNAPIENGYADSVSCRMEGDSLVCMAKTQDTTCDAGYGLANPTQQWAANDVVWSSENTTGICVACSGATYSDANVCVACPGSYTYNQNSDMTDKTQCQLYIESGYYVATPGAEPQKCPAGYYCPGGIVLNYGDVAWNNVPTHRVETLSDDEAAGYHNPEYLIGYKTDKGVGAYSCNQDIHELDATLGAYGQLLWTSDAGAKSITECYTSAPTGQYLGWTPENGLDILECAQGTFNSNATRSYYKEFGHISNDEDWQQYMIDGTVCDVCDDTEYQDKVGQTSCRACPTVPYSEFAMTRTADRTTCAYKSVKTINVDGGSISGMQCELGSDGLYVCQTDDFKCSGGRYYNNTIFDATNCYYDGSEYYCSSMLDYEYDVAGLAKDEESGVYYLYNNVQPSCAGVAQPGEYSPNDDIDRYSCADFGADMPAYSENVGATSCETCPFVGDEYAEFVDKYSISGGRHTINNCKVQFKSDAPIPVDGGNITITNGCTYKDGGYNNCSARVSDVQCSTGYYNTNLTGYSCDTFNAQNWLNNANFAPVCNMNSSNASASLAVALSTLNQSQFCYVASTGHFAYNNMLLECPAGTYQSTTGGTNCVVADAGYYVPNAGASGQMACVGTTYSDAQGMSECKSCPAPDVWSQEYDGITDINLSYASGVTHDRANGCQYDFNMSVENGTVPDMTCLYKDNGTDNTNDDELDQCVAHSLSDIVCDAGYGIDSGDYGNDIDAWANNQSTNLGKTSLSDYIGKTGWCESCPDGSYSTGDGAVCAQCTGQHEISNSDHTGCECATGYGYVDGVCAADVIHCDDGQYLPQGATQCAPCTEGNFCKAANYLFNPNYDQGLKNCNTEIRNQNIAYQDNRETIGKYDSIDFTSAAGASDIKQCRTTVPAGKYITNARGEFGVFELDTCFGQMYNSQDAVQYYGAIKHSDNCALKCPDGTHIHNGNQVSVPGVVEPDGKTCSVCPKYTDTYADNVIGYKYYDEDYNTCAVNIKLDTSTGYQNIWVDINSGYIFDNSVYCNPGHWLNPYSNIEQCDMTSVSSIAETCGVCDVVGRGNWGSGGINPSDYESDVHACPAGYNNGPATAASESECAYRLGKGQFIKTATAQPVQCEAGDWCSGDELISYGKTGGNQSCAKSVKYAMFAELSPTSSVGASSPEECYITVAKNQYVDMLADDKYTIEICPAGTQATQQKTQMYFSDINKDTEWGVSARCGTCPNGTWSETAGGSCVQCPENKFCNATSAKPYSCAAVTGNKNAIAPAGSDAADDCYITCSSDDIDVNNGTAIPVSSIVKYAGDQDAFVCQFKTGISIDGNPCNIVKIANGKYECVETSCVYDQIMGKNGCEPCDVDGAVSYLDNGGNCVVATCKPGLHPDANRCVENVMDCTGDVSFAESAERYWNDATGAFGQCVATACESGYHISNGVCLPDERNCVLPHGVGTQEWNHNTKAWDKCIATQCDPGWTNDAHQTNASDPSQCGVCANKFDADDMSVVAVSSYISECEIATCMYHNEKYALNNNQCEQICVGDDETGRRYWDDRLKRCVHECAVGYTQW